MSAGLIIQGNTGKWEVVIGLEIHAQIISQSKLFSDARTSSGEAPNSNVALVDCALPGMLPVLNKECIKQAVKTGLSINAKINKKSIFDRKNYFYPDLPQGYQISQFSDPLVGEGKIDIYVDGNKKTINIERIHVEQDAGKSIHDQNPEYSFVDLNRSGIALMEIVSKPDLRSGEEAVEYIKKLRNIMRYINSCDGDMEKGSLRCDANISVRKVGDNNLGTRCEIKNLNSTKFLIKAIQYEAERQVEILESGGTVDQETRLYDSVNNITATMRSKEDAHDYRYFPDPDLPPLNITDEFIEEIKKTIPELPDEKRRRYIEDLNIPEYDADVIISDVNTANYFDKVINKINNAKLVVTWITAELFGKLNKVNCNIENSPINAESMIELLSFIEDKTISAKIAKEVFTIMFDTNKSAEEIIEEKGLKQITDIDSITDIIVNIINNNNDKVEQYRSGKTKLLGFFVGEVMKATQGKANPKIVNQILAEKLN